MLAPWWCVNEGTTGCVFATAKSAANDHTLSLTKSGSKITKIVSSLKNQEASRTNHQRPRKWHIIQTLQKCAQFGLSMYHHLNIQSLILDASEKFKNGIFKNSIKLKYNTKLTLETMNKLNKLTLEMQPAKDHSNCVRVVECQLPLAGTRP